MTTRTIHIKAGLPPAPLCGQELSRNDPWVLSDNAQAWIDDPGEGNQICAGCTEALAGLQTSKGVV